MCPATCCRGARGQSWEWLTQVRPYESWKYDAIGKPLWSRAEGFTRLEDLGEGRTRLHFTEYVLTPSTRCFGLCSNVVCTVSSRETTTGSSPQPSTPGSAGCAGPKSVSSNGPRPLRRDSGGIRTTVVGEGRPVLLLHGFAMTPTVYEDTAKLLSTSAGVSIVMPWLFALPGGWSPHRALDALSALVEALDIDQTSIIGHSFSGGLELGVASRHPEKIAELVFADTLGLSREWHLAGEFFRHPVGLVRLATVPPRKHSRWSVTRHPVQLARAGWWGFVSDRRTDSRRRARRGNPVACVVGRP